MARECHAGPRASDAFMYPLSYNLPDTLQRHGLVYGEKCQFQAGRDPEFVEDIAEVMLYRVLADFEVFSNFLVGVSGYHGGYNLQLARREPEFFLSSFFARGLD